MSDKRDEGSEIIKKDVPGSDNNAVQIKSGMARVKQEYLAEDRVRKLDLTYVSNTDKKNFEKKVKESSEEAGERPRKKLKGQNKSRPHRANIPRASKICFKFIADNCPLGDKCCFSHNLTEYLSSRPPDIGSSCYLFDTFGKCKYGVTCRFGSGHLNSDGTNVINDELSSKKNPEQCECNALTRDLQFALRKKKFDFKKSSDVLENIKSGSYKSEIKQAEEADVENGGDEPSTRIGCVIENEEKKKLDFKGKLYLAPLTTVGNLPFRRICKEYGADITCGEMALATNLLQGQQSEWALLKRHSSEDLFGVQICGAHGDLMTRCAEMLSEKCKVDFVDINMGCPIDLIYQKGAGSGLMNRIKKLDEIIYGMSSVMDVPLTVKMRTGIHESKPIALNVIQEIKKWNGRVSLMTLHGRSREQRYTKMADWDYVEKCAKAAHPIPLFGSGDILSYEDSNLRLQSSVSGVMIARGALIKPWIFTEIKEQRNWDISSSERFDMLKRFMNYGLEHWGSDTEGVERTRRFLLEWLSFLHRYIPVGLLEVVPQKINERPPPYNGRDDLETLMASPFCADWVKISEMLLGPTPSDFIFLPKHKANAYSA